MVAVELWDVRREVEHAIELVPPYWIEDAEIITLEENYDVLLFERFADGTLLVTPPADWVSSVGNTELLMQLRTWSHGNGGIALGANTGIEFPDKSLFAPDATYFSEERWAKADHSKTFVGEAPDAAFELLSKSDRLATTMKKVRAYLKNGVRLVVLIDAWDRHVYVGRDGDDEPRDLGDVDSVDCSPAMPGFVLNIAAVTRYARR